MLPFILRSADWRRRNNVLLPFSEPVVLLIAQLKTDSTTVSKPSRLFKNVCTQSKKRRTHMAVEEEEELR